jgi:hypothetical protein
MLIIPTVLWITGKAGPFLATVIQRVTWAGPAALRRRGVQPDNGKAIAYKSDTGRRHRRGLHLSALSPSLAMSII